MQKLFPSFEGCQWPTSIALFTLLLSSIVGAEPTMEEIRAAVKAREATQEKEAKKRPKPSSLVPSRHYSLEDLQILERNKNYREFLEHARDVRPSKRKSPWKEMVQNMATQYIDFAIERQQYDQSTFKRIYKLSSWAPLRGDEYFHVKWQKYGTLAIENCLKINNEKCLSWHNQLWDSTSPNPDFALEMANLKEQINPRASLWKYYKHVTKSKVAIFHCRRPDVQKNVFERIHRRAYEEGLQDKELRSHLLKIMSPVCWKQMVSEIKKIMHGPKPQQMSAYKALSSMDALSTQEEDFYLVRYLLSNPKIGRLFNKSWAKLKELSKFPKRRERVLNKLKSLDPLPGEIFGIEDHEKKAGVLDHFARNFTEYLDYYGKTCLDYLQGKRIFPRGNPTVECRDLFRAQKKETENDWLHQGLRIQYSSLQKPSTLRSE